MVEADDNFMTVLLFLELCVIFGCIYFYDTLFKNSTNSTLGSNNRGQGWC